MQTMSVFDPIITLMNKVPTIRKLRGRRFGWVCTSVWVFLAASTIVMALCFSVNHKSLSHSHACVH
jgi:hypothetical protein